MLTIKQITEDKEAVIRGLEKKRFENAREIIEKVIAVDNKRKVAQANLDALLAESKVLSKSIGALMKEHKVDEADSAKQKVGEIKSKAALLEEEMKAAAMERQQILYTIPNVPYEEVPEGTCAADNVIVKTGGVKTQLPENPLPHWDLAKKYNLIDFDLGVKITGAGFPVYVGLGARLQRALINFFLD